MRRCEQWTPLPASWDMFRCALRHAPPHAVSAHGAPLLRLLQAELQRLAQVNPEGRLAALVEELNQVEVRVSALRKRHAAPDPHCRNRSNALQPRAAT